MRYESDQKKENLQLAACFALSALVYVIIVLPYLALPSLGQHAWNEVNYLGVLHIILANNNPFLYYQAYDTNRPDFNGGYIYYFTAYLFTKLVNTLCYLPEIVILRILSIISTLLSLAVLFLILEEFGINRRSILVVLLLFLFSPAVVYFGWKVQLEPFLILLFLISQLLLIRYEKNKRQVHLFCVSSIMLGMLIGSHSTFLVFLPLYTALFIFPENKKELFNYDSIKRGFLSLFIVAIGVITVLLPSSILYPQYNPLVFFYMRIFGMGDIINSLVSRVNHLILDFIDRVLWEQIVLLFLLSLPSLLLFKKTITHPDLRFYYLLLLVTILAFFSLTYKHDINHTYQIYYALLWFIIGAAITLNFLSSSIKENIFYLFILSMMLVNFYLSFSYITSFYGLYTNRIYESVDGYGSYESYVASITIRHILDKIDNPPGYILVQSPPAYYMTYHPSITYQELYEWNNETKTYYGYSFFDNETAFVDQIKNRNIALLTITPDVNGKISKEFSEYKKTNFVDICSTKNFIISMNQSLFYENPTIGTECMEFLYELSKNDSLAAEVIPIKNSSNQK